MNGSSVAATTQPLAAAGSPRRPATQAAPVQPQSIGRPLLDLARGTGGFPLAAGDVPASSAKLIASLRRAYAERVLLPDRDDVVRVVGEPANLEELTIDVSGGRVRDDYKPAGAARTTREPEPALRARRLAYVAEPLRYGEARINVRITADDAVLAPLLDKAGHASLVLTDCSDGTAAFHATQEDLRKFLMVGARNNGRRAALFISRVDLKLASDGPHALSAEFRASGLWLLLPTTVTFSVRVDIDEHFNARLSQMDVKGEDLGGALAASLVRRGFQKQEGTLVPLAHFPGDRVVIRDLNIDTSEDSLRVNVRYGPR